MSFVFTFARSLVSISGGIGAFGVYKAHYDPPHLIWDLDETVLRSITPIDKALKSQDHPTDPSWYFDQIDDDFPFIEGVPNTRTYWRPGALLALRFCRLFSNQHVFTAAQGTYTDNIMAKLDPDKKLFDQVIHRDLIGRSIAGGKDVTVITNRLDRVLLFDDKLKNFRPQQGRNGILVRKYLNVGQGYFGEIQEVLRMVAIAVMALYVSDTRVIADYFTGEDYREQFGRP